MVKNIGMIGVSEGNGHPYSFSAIINGYDKVGMQHSGWPGIFDYLEKQPESEFGIEGFKVSHVWTQSPEESKKIAAATNIARICEGVDDMVPAVDAVIIARDDWENHLSLAMPFLKAGKAVFIDKPLSLAPDELNAFLPFLRKGQLMSCSGLRYAKELDAYRQQCAIDFPKAINAAVVCDWEKYGVHLLDGIFSGIPFNVKSVYSVGDIPRSTTLECYDGKIINLLCLGQGPKTFSFTIFSDNHRQSFDVDDNFTAFKRTLVCFRDMIINKQIQIDPNLTLNIMKTLLAGNTSARENRVVGIDEITF